MESDIPAEALTTIQRGTLGYTYKGVPCIKNPFDLALYTKLLYEQKPRTIIEIGSASGGSALWFADMLRSFAIDGRVVSIDRRRVTRVADPLVSFVAGDALRLSAVLTDRDLKVLPRPWLVVEDSAHTYEVCLAVLRFFEPHLQAGDYIVIEDGIVNDLQEPVYARLENGPNRAIIAFLQATDRFQIDTGYCDFFGHNFTYCTNGFLRCS